MDSQEEVINEGRGCPVCWIVFGIVKTECHHGRIDPSNGKFFLYPMDRRKPKKKWKTII
jgi:hypothetical protein